MNQTKKKPETKQPRTLFPDANFVFRAGKPGEVQTQTTPGRKIPSTSPAKPSFHFQPPSDVFQRVSSEAVPKD